MFTDYSFDEFLVITLIIHIVEKINHANGYSLLLIMKINSASQTFPATSVKLAIRRDIDTHIPHKNHQTMTGRNAYHQVKLLNSS